MESHAARKLTPKNIKNVMLKLYKVDIDANEKDDQKINQILTKKTSEEDALNQINSLKFNNSLS